MNAKAAAIDEAALPDYVRAFDTEFEFVHRTLRRHGVPPADCDDLAQEVFLVTWRRWHDYDPHRPLRAWLTGIVFRVARDYRRSVRRRTRPELTPDLPEEAPMPDAQVAVARTRSLVLRALHTLPEPQRELLVRHELDGQAIRDIARASSLPLFTVYTRLRRARLRFAAEVRRLRGERTRGERTQRRAWWLWPLGAALALGVAVVVVAVGRPHLSRPAPAAGLPGLIGHWSFDERGAVVRDLSGNGGDCQPHDFDPRGGPVAGVHGGALRFTPQGWLSCPQRPLAGARQALSVAAWVRKARGRRAATTLVTRQLGEARLFSLGFQDDRVFVRSELWKVDLSAPLPSHDRWVHVAFSHEGPATHLYLDGVEVATARDGLAAPAPAAGELTIGAARFATDPVIRQRLDGAIDELYAFDRALSPAEIAALAR